MIRKYFLLLIAVFFNALLWIYVVPIWHTPDEQAHFAQVTFMSNSGRVAAGNEYDLTEEIYISEVLLGTERDKIGNNKFTFHPQFRIDYTNGYTGIHEPYIASLYNAKTYVKAEATRYPPLYYAPAAALLWIFPGENLFVRVYLVRFWSLFLFLLNVALVIKLGKLIFHPSSMIPFVLGILVGFQPMMVFANIGVTSDTLGNLFFTVFLYFATLIIVRGLTLDGVISLILILILSLYAKPQFIVMVPLTGAISVLYFIPKIRRENAWKIITSISLVFVFIVAVLYLLRNGPASIIAHVFNNFNLNSFTKFTREYTISHTYSEVLPWYWGVFDWLGVTYPRVVHRIINRVLVICLFGFILWTVNIVRKKLIIQKRILAVGFLILAAVLFYAGIAAFDWLLWSKSGFPLGVQGRYLFPAISSHMIVLLIGVSFILPRKFPLRPIFIAILPFFMLILNIIALYTVASTYYEINTFTNLVVQASQYKPWFAKGLYLIAVFSASIVTIIVFVVGPLLRSFKNTRSFEQMLV